MTGEVKRCSKCGEEKPLSGFYFVKAKQKHEGACIVCRQARAKQRMQTCPETREASRRAQIKYREKHKEVMKIRRDAPEEKSRKAAYERKRYLSIKADPTRYAELKEKGNASRRERLKSEERREKQRVQLRERYARNPMKYIAMNSNYRAKRLETSGTFDNMDISAAFSRQKGKCLYCGAKVGTRGKGVIKWHVDHFIPLARGGTNEPTNIVIACQPCNNSKHSKMPWEFMPDRFSPPESQAAD